MLRFFSLLVALLCLVCGALPTIAQERTNVVRGLDPTKPADKYIYTHWQIEQGLPQNNGQ